MSIDNLTIRRVAIDAYDENVAYLNRECNIYRAEGFQVLSKIMVSTNGSRLLVVVNVMIIQSFIQVNRDEERGQSLHLTSILN